MRRWVLFALPVVMLAASSPALAQSVASEKSSELLQELFVSEAVYVQEAGELQLTLGASMLRTERRTRRSAPAMIEFGVTSRLQVSAEAVFAVSRDSLAPATLSEPELGLAFAIRRDVERLALTVGLDREFDDDAVGSGWSPSVRAAQSLGNAQLHAGVRWEGTTAWWGSVAGIVPMGPWRASLEVGGMLNGRFGGVVAPSLTWVSSSGLEVGLGLPIGFGAEAYPRGLVVLLTWETEL